MGLDDLLQLGLMYFGAPSGLLFLISGAFMSYKTAKEMVDRQGGKLTDHNEFLICIGCSVLALIAGYIWVSALIA